MAIPSCAALACVAVNNSFSDSSNLLCRSNAIPRYMCVVAELLFRFEASRNCSSACEYCFASSKAMPKFKRDGKASGLSLHASLRTSMAVSYTHLRAHETPEHLVCRLLLE